jgi:hypothetical protein
MTEKMKKPEGAQSHPASENIIRQQHSNSSEDQRARLLKYLITHGSISTLEARAVLDILCPAPRIFELRRFGHFIETVWINQSSDCGRVHRIGLYILQAGGAHGAA